VLLPKKNIILEIIILALKKVGFPSVQIVISGKLVDAGKPGSRVAGNPNED
jgi:hypothetical protein